MGSEKIGTVRQDEPPVMPSEAPSAPRTLAESERENTREMGYASDGELARQQHDVPRQTGGGTYSFLGPNDESGERSFAAEEAGADIHAYERDIASEHPLRDRATMETTPEPKSGGSLLGEEAPPKPTRFDQDIDEANRGEPMDE